jgi:hypothetical protein
VDGFEITGLTELELEESMLKDNVEMRDDICRPMLQINTYYPYKIE